MSETNGVTIERIITRADLERLASFAADIGIVNFQIQNLLARRDALNREYTGLLEKLTPSDVTEDAP